VFGGSTLTLSDIATAAGIVEIGDRARVAHLKVDMVKAVMAKVHADIADICDRMKSDAREVPLIAVGGGSMLVPDVVAGFSSVVRVEN
ncbi:hydantoinase/oxoprolinase family protein, partial [Mycobacterium tuberculosis]|nr:hydantoinase/oxoprolinase family protein [Mycobacterium tuberculosis]